MPCMGRGGKHKPGPKQVSLVSDFSVTWTGPMLEALVTRVGKRRCTGVHPLTLYYNTILEELFRKKNIYSWIS